MAMSSNMSTTPIASNDDCLAAEAALRGPLAAVVRCASILLQLTTIGLSALVVRQYVRQRVALHANLACLFANILLTCVANALGHLAMKSRYQFLLFTYTEPCQLLTPVWLCIALLVPNYVYSVAFPLFHFAVMTERMRATLQLRDYERQGKCWALATTALVWALSAGYCTAVVASSLGDSVFRSSPQVAIHLTTDANAQAINCVTGAALVLVAATCAGDWCILRMNAAKSARKWDSVGHSGASYSLSGNFQLNENLVCMRLILPLDVAYALLYSLYSSLVLLIRHFRDSISTTQYIFYYDSALLLLFTFNICTLAIYLRFIRLSKRRRHSKVAPAPQQGELYFRSLMAQWT